MTDSNSPNHWDALASNLGATPAPEQTPPNGPSPPPAQLLPPRKPTRRGSHHEQAAPAAPNWDLLASELGVSPAPPPIPPAPAIVPPPLPEQSRRATPPPEAPEESPNFFDERFDFEEPFDLLESSEPPAPTAETTAEATAETPEPAEKRPRRRRRRRGRGGDRKDSRKTDVPAPSDGGPTNDAPTADSTELDVVAERPEPARSDRSGERAEEDASAEQRPKRRRPRRGKKRRAAEAGGGVAERLPQAPNSTAHPTSQDEDVIEAEVIEEEELDFGEEVEGEQPARGGFRGIPTWDEAVGLLIDKNIEAHARRPASAQHQSHGNRGRGGKRRS